MLASEETQLQPGAPALHIVEEAQRSLSECLMFLRIKKDHIRIRPVRLGRVKDAAPPEANAWALHIVLRESKRRWTSDMRPTSLWLVAAYEDRIQVLASGSGAWEFKRVELAQALEKMREVLATV